MLDTDDAPSFLSNSYPACLDGQKKRNGKSPSLCLGTVFVISAFTALGLISGCTKPLEGSPPLTPAQRRFNDCLSRKTREADSSGETVSSDELEKSCRSYALTVQSSANPTATADSPPTDQEIADRPHALNYKVLKLTRKPYQNCVADIQLPQEIGRPELMQIAESFKQHECAGISPMLLGFYLPGMKMGKGSWANAQYDPTLSGPGIRVLITGSQPKAIATIQAFKLAPGEELIGAWSDASIGLVYKIIKKNGQYYEYLSSNPSLSPTRNNLRASDSANGQKFQIVGSASGDYVVIARGGNLLEYDRDGFIKSLPRLQR